MSAALTCVLVVLAIPVVLPSVALAGGDEDQKSPPSAGPPGPWDGPSRRNVTYRRPGTKRCAPASARHAGAGTVLGIYVRRADCRTGRRIVRAYRRCLTSEAGRAGRCYSRIRSRCVQPEFLGRCRRSDRFFQRSVRGYRCTERRLYPIGTRYDGDVMCVKRGRRISHAYTLFAGGAVDVSREAQLRAAWADPRRTWIRVTPTSTCAPAGSATRSASPPVPMTLDGAGHRIQQTCFEKRLLRQDGTGHLVIKDVTLTRGGSDGPGAAVTTRGEITVVDSVVKQNLAEEPGGGIFSMRRATIIRSVMTGNLANDDGGGVYARRGGVRVFDSIISSNLVDGSGGAIGSTGDILVVRSHIDGNTTDGDGGALYTDEEATSR